MIITLGDSHVYLNHLKMLSEQLEREPTAFPQLKIKTKKDQLWDYEFEDLELVNYKPQGKLTAPMAV